MGNPRYLSCSCNTHMKCYTIAPYEDSMCIYCCISAAHCEVLQTVNSLYLASTLSQLQQTSQAGQSWGALKEPLLRECATVLLTHIIKVLCVYVHIIEERDPEAREKVELYS